jgi:hypothetical protein
MTAQVLTAMSEVRMPRRSKAPGLDSSEDLARKVEILEREMATQRAALERLKEMSVQRTSRGDAPATDARTPTRA